MVCGCAHSPPASEADLSSAYRAVRHGDSSAYRAGDYLLCSTLDGLEVSLTRNDGPADWADKFSSRRVQDDVTARLAGDPLLRGEAINARTVHGEVILSGHVSSDEVAIRAMKDALSVAGAVAVRIELTSPESPGRPRLGTVAYCD